MAVLLGLLSATGFGAADFLGGLAARRIPTLTVVVGAQLSGLVVALAIAPFFDAPHVSRAEVGYGAGAGAIGVVGVALLYRGLAAGRMSVIAPITAVGAAIVPVAWGLGTGERPSAVALAGVAAAIPAVVLISRVPAGDEGDEAAGAGARTELLLASGAGVCFGFALVLFGESADGTGMWPLVAARVASVGLFGAGALATGRLVAPGRALVPLIVATGVLDMSANGCYVAGAGTGLVSLVAVLSSLYPAGTVLLARVVLGERLVRHQVAGLALALAGATLIAAG